MSSVTINGVTLRYGDVTAVHEVNLEIRDGEFCVLLGPSGCGKTSLLRMIAGLVRPTSGHIQIGGRDVTEVHPSARGIAMVFQSYALYPHLRVRDNFAYPLRAASVPRAEVEARVREVGELLHMEHFLDRYPRELSGGQQQRVAIGRALITRPQVFLLDEPLGNLDAKLREQMRSVLKKLQQDLGVTTIYVTHDQLEAQGLADKLVVMDMGRVQQVGTPEHVYEDPRNIFVAYFIGTPSVNLARGQLQEQPGGYRIQNGHMAIPIDAGLASRLAGAAGASLVAAVRPEHVQLWDQPGPDTVPGEIYVVAPQNNELVVDVRVGEVAVKARVVKEGLGFRPRPGQPVHLRFPPEKLMVFDGRSEARMV